MDLQELDVVSAANEGAWCTLYNPKTGDDLVTYLDKDGNVLKSEDVPKSTSKQKEIGLQEVKWRIKVLGADSDAYQKIVQQRVREDAQKQASRRNRQQVQIDFEELKLENAQQLAKTTVGWEGLVSGGKALGFSEKNAVEIYLNHPWIREQIDAFQGERSNFLGG